MSTTEWALEHLSTCCAQQGFGKQAAEVSLAFGECLLEAATEEATVYHLNC